MAKSNHKHTQQSAVKETEHIAPQLLPMLKINFLLMGIAAIVILAGFILMLGASSTSTEFNPDIFSFRRIVLGPTIAFLGFLFMGFAIIYKKRVKKEETTD